MNSCHSLTKFLQPANATCLPTQSDVCSVYTGRTRSSSLASSTTRIFLIANHQPVFHMHHAPLPYLWNQLPSSFRQPLPRPFSPDLKLISFTNTFPIVTLTLYSFRTDFTSTELKGHCFVCFSFWLRVLDLADTQLSSPS